MTSPRQILPGTTYFVTRRCLERRFFLTPTPLTTAVFRYLLAVVASRHGILLHAYCALSNHFHLVLTDPNALLPEFMRELNSTLARFLNAVHGRKETVFAPGSYDAITLEDEGAVMAKCAYALANPVELVACAREWPGAWSPPESIGAAGELIDRPKAFFDSRGGMPERATLQLVVPPGADPEPFRRTLAARIARLERETADRQQADGCTPLSVRRVEAQSVENRGVSEEERHRHRAEASASEGGLRRAALARLRAFREAYREALLRLRKGFQDVVFPAGTYLLRMHLNVRCAPA